VKQDTHKLDTYEAFLAGVTEDVDQSGMRGPRPTISLKGFAEQRRAYILNHQEVKQVTGKKGG